MLERLSRNWPLKLLALGLAFAIWIAVTGDARVLQVYAVPLDISLPQDCIVAGPAPTKVNVSLRGPESAIRRLDPLKLSFRLDLTDAAPGQRNVQLAAESLAGLESGIEVVRIEPDRFRLTVDRRLRKVLGVAPFIVGTPPAGFALYGARASPDRLEVEGPRNEVLGLDRLRTDPIHVDGKTASFVAVVNAVPDRPATRIVDPREISVQVEVDALPVKRGFDSVPVALTGRQFESAAQPSGVRILVSGPPALVLALRPDRIRAVAQISGLAPRREPYMVQVRIEFLDVSAPDLPRIAVKSVSPATIAVRISGRRIAT
jgi:YbbR domain-containing protein